MCLSLTQQELDYLDTTLRKTTTSFVGAAMKIKALTAFAAMLAYEWAVWSLDWVRQLIGRAFNHRMPADTLKGMLAITRTVIAGLGEYRNWATA